jgi:flagellar basal body-associated protein FliL
MCEIYNNLEVLMYIDGVILFSLLMIALILWMMAYVGIYFFRHIKQDTEKQEKKVIEAKQKSFS